MALTGTSFGRFIVILRCVDVHRIRTGHFPLRTSGNFAAYRYDDLKRCRGAMPKGPTVD
jgi:hypothetical protein